MNDKSERLIRKFNPGAFQSDEEVVRQFVVRQRELDLVLEVIRGNIDSPSCQHLLLVAPRGRGKTMLLARVGAELRADDALSRRLFPVRFMEESQEIFTLADFWLEALFHLAHAVASADPDFSQGLLATHADLAARWQDTNIEGHARAAFLEAADRLGRKLVLMVENLQALCGDAGKDFGWQLRQALQSEPQVMLLATAVSRFRGLDEAPQPFFELFRIIDLEPLDTDACLRLWNMASGDEQKKREIRPLRILTGGNPRLLIIVSTFARRRSLRQLLENLVALVDDHTEYFRGHLEHLAKTERRVYLAVIDLWQPSSAQEIAARARVDVRTVSALIARLVDRGAVLVEGTGRKRKYAAAERLYSIYYKLRRERDEAGLVRNLIQFMTVFYHGDELVEMVDMWRGEAAESPAIREGLERALADPDARELQVGVATALFKKGVTHGQRDESEAELSVWDDLVGRYGSSGATELQLLVAEALFNKGVEHGRRDETETELSAYDDLVGRYGSSAAPAFQLWVAKALFNKGVTHGRRNESEAELSVWDDLVGRYGSSAAPELQFRVAKALLNRGITHSQRDESEAELAAYDELVASYGASTVPELQLRVARALFNKGVAHRERDESEAALAVLDDLVERYDSSVAPELQVEVTRALLFKGELQIEIGRAEEALHVSEEFERWFGAVGDDEPEEAAFLRWRAGWIRTQALFVQGEHAAALRVFQSVCATFVAGDETMLREMLARVPVLVAAGAPPRDLVEILAADSRTAALAPLVVALRRLAGESVRASAEVLAVADDVLERIEAAKQRAAGRSDG